MDNVFRKLVRREFGAENYARYCRYIFYETGRQKVQNPMIYEDMYHFLEGKDRQALLFMKSRLDSVLLQAFVICKGYFAKLIAALGTIFLVCILKPQQPIYFLLVSAVGLGLAVKTYEYIVNKYCYVDARIVLIYKIVLERLCPGGKPGAGG